MSDGVIEQVDTPFNIYNSPRNEKVARFIGSIVEIPGSVLSEREVLVCNSILSCGPLGIGTGVGVTLMVRPEEFQLSQDTSRTDSLIGRVTRTEFRGSQTMVFLDIPGLPEEIIALAPPAFGQLSIGSIIAVRLVEGFSRVA
jgi:ABC-type Fe3+/spermidine/putrescine transport system ATPase subunit